jgi:hypothetical protein
VVVGVAADFLSAPKDREVWTLGNARSLLCIAPVRQDRLPFLRPAGQDGSNARCPRRCLMTGVIEADRREAQSG